MNTHPYLQVLDLSALTPADLEELWQHEVRVWRDRLLWDVSDVWAALRRLVERRRLPGKAVRVNAQTVGYAYYGVAESLGMIAGVVVAPDWCATDIGEVLLRHTVDEMRRKGVSRIESLFISVDCPWLAAAFERGGFRTHWREFLRIELCPSMGPVNVPAIWDMEAWRPTHVHEAATILQAAYEAGVEAEIHEPYRSVEGCRVALDRILNQGSCGVPVPEASLLARHRGRGIGFVVVTEVGPRQAHLPQVAVLPEYQHRGIGRLLMDYSRQRLAERRFAALSLIVSRANQRAFEIYRAMGFQPVLEFPVFIWER